MASKGSKQNAPQAASRGDSHQTIVLPQFPRSDDTKVQRSKWIQDYDRVQSELLRNHLTDVTASGAPSTTTVSLRQLPQDWEEQMRQQQAQKAQLEAMRQKVLEKKKKEQTVTRSLGNGDANGTSMMSSMMSTAGRNRNAANDSPTNAHKRSSPSRNADTISPQHEARRAAAFSKARAATADLYATQQGKFGSDTFSSPSPARSRLHAVNASRALSPIRPGTAGSTAGGGTSYSRLNLSPLRSHGGLLNESGVGSPHNESVVTTFAASRLPNTDECARIVNFLAVPQAAASVKATVRPDLSFIDLKWLKRYRPGDQVGCSLTLDSMREDIFTVGGHSSLASLHRNPSPSVSAASSANGSTTTATALNSPRSIIVLLRNGCTVEDLQQRPMDYFRTGKHKESTAHNSSSLALGPGSRSSEAMLSEETASMAQKHFEERRNALMAALRAEYRNLCREVPLLDLIESSYSLRSALLSKNAINGKKGMNDSSTNDEALAADVTFLKERKERLAIRRELELEQLAKQQAMAEQVRRKAAENEEKRFLADLDHKRLIEHRREEAFARRREAEKRQEELRQATEKLNAEYQDKLEERRHRLEEKEQKMKENRLTHREAIRQNAQAKAARREARRERQLELQEELSEQVIAKRQEHEEAEAERRAKREREMQIHKEQLTVSQKQANERRLESKRAAEEYENEIRQRAIEKAEVANQKLAEFQQKLKQRRSEQAQQEAKRSELRQRTLQVAVERQEDKRESFITKRTSVERQMGEMEAIRRRTAAKESEREREVEDDKRMYVKRRTLAVQFDQLMSIANVERKKEKGEAVARQRDRLVEMTLKEREKIRLQRERYEEELYAKAVANQLS